VELPEARATLGDGHAFETKGSAEGEAEPLVSVESAHGVTFVVTLLALFPDTGSLGDVELTLAVSVKAPFCVGLITRVTVTFAPLAIAPMVHTTDCCLGFGAQVPCVELTDPTPAFFGRVSVIVTPFAVEGPLLVTTIV
jgi:hypothetical protein